MHTLDLETASLIKQRDTLTTTLETIRSLASLPSNSATHQLALGRLNKIVDSAGQALRTVGVQ